MIESVVCLLLFLIPLVYVGVFSDVIRDYKNKKNIFARRGKVYFVNIEGFWSSQQFCSVIILSIKKQQTDFAVNCLELNYNKQFTFYCEYDCNFLFLLKEKLRYHAITDVLF